MQLQIDSDAAYLVNKNGRSRAGGYHFLGNHNGKLFNGLIYIYIYIYILAKIIRAVMALAAEAKCGSLYMNAQNVILHITTLEELEHRQHPVLITALQTES